jgi:glycosyltransferase involved in cell wall biosynthesis
MGDKKLVYGYIMKIGIDTFGCDHARSGLGSYLLYFVANLPQSTEDQFELFGSELDRYTYSSDKEIDFVSVSVPDSLQYEKLWHYTCSKKFTNKRNYDLVLYPAVERILPIKFKTKSIAVVNSILSTQIESMDFFSKKLLKKGLNNIQVIVAASKYIKDDLIALGVAENKITVIYNGIDHKLFYPALDIDSDNVEINPFSIKRPYFIYGSRLSGPDKKHIELIKAFEQFKKNTGLPHRLVLAGSDGDYSNEIHKAVFKSDFTSDIFLTGYFPHESFPSLYSGADACVFPSVNEGVGLPILEAMACGIPVLCSSKGALPEAGGDVPLYFDSDNVENITECLVKIVEDKQLRQSMVEKGLERASKFSWDSTVEKTIEFAKKMV